MTKLTLLPLVLAAILGASNVFSLDYDLDFFFRTDKARDKEELLNSQDDIKLQERPVSAHLLTPNQKIDSKSYFLEYLNKLNGNTGEKLQRCYNCLGCPTVQRNTSTIYCNNDNAPSICVVYETSYIKSSKSGVYRGCVSDLGNCATIEKSLAKDPGKLIDCKECEGDLCNASGAFNVRASVVLFTSLLMAMILNIKNFMYS